jgi:hypothetical protein
MGLTFTRLRRSLGIEHAVPLEASWAEAGLERELREFKTAVEGSMPNPAHRDAQAATDLEIIDIVCGRISRQQDMAVAAASICTLYERIANDVVADSALVGKTVVTAASTRFRDEFLKADFERKPREQSPAAWPLFRKRCRPDSGVLTQAPAHAGISSRRCSLELPNM